MKVKKKFISFSKRLCILSLCVVIGLVVSLQGFCVSSVNSVVTCNISPVPGTYVEGGYSSSKQRSFAVKSINATYLNVDIDTYEISNIPSFDLDKKYMCSFKYDIVCSSKQNYLYPYSCYVDIHFDAYNQQRSYPVRYDHNDAYGYRLYFDFEIPSNYSTIVNFTIHFSFNTNMSTYTTNHAISPLSFTITTETDKVIEQFGSNYSKPNTSDVDNYNNAESQLYNGVASSLDDINSQWKNINGDLLQYQGAFLAVNKFFNNLTGLDWIKVVLILSVSIGMFALLLGAVNSVFKGRGD